MGSPGPDDRGVRLEEDRAGSRGASCPISLRVRGVVHAHADDLRARDDRGQDARIRQRQRARLSCSKPWNIGSPVSTTSSSSSTMPYCGSVPAPVLNRAIFTARAYLPAVLLHANASSRCGRAGRPARCGERGCSGRGDDVRRRDLALGIRRDREVDAVRARRERAVSAALIARDAARREARALEGGGSRVERARAIEPRAHDPARAIGARSPAEHLADERDLAREARGRLAVGRQLDAAEDVVDETADGFVDARGDLLDSLVDEPLDDVVERRARRAAARPEGERSGESGGGETAGACVGGRGAW